MSDFPQGSDWQKGEDGKWRPPEDAESNATTSANSNSAQSNATMGCLVAVAVVVVLVIVFAALGSSSSDDGGGSTAEDREFGAFDVCQQFVRDDLKAPSTATFRNFFEDDGEVLVSGTGSGPYTVRSSVDAENGFGAQIRSDFVCVVTNTGGDSWRLVSLTLD